MQLPKARLATALQTESIGKRRRMKADEGAEKKQVGAQDAFESGNKSMSNIFHTSLGAGIASLDEAEMVTISLCQIRLKQRQKKFKFCPLDGLLF